MKGSYPRKLSPLGKKIFDELVEIDQEWINAGFSDFEDIAVVFKKLKKDDP